ncbi:shikimate kinase [Periweissella fabaria]|uniref:Shikimate kinase n=1 Tax=Periweissella fabaria TaxID=546157 RepID=A0ABN8BL40_9LACO|nr:shikimate kinase [Periweissella fabaria]MCM0596934.1 shikimate kinase [Periweissella fabaria]CAH0416889.1 Shikimate kinase [Periweissella fabaria]
MQIILVGFMGVGKTTVGQLLAQQLGQPFVDLDYEFTMTMGATPGTYMHQFSEEQFRIAEYQILKKQLAKPNAVISSGGGIVTLPISRELMTDSNYFVVYLVSDFEVNIKRLIGDTNARPLVTKLSRNDLHHLWQMRQKHYHTVADLSIDTNGKTPTTIVEQIINKLNRGKTHG